MREFGPVRIVVVLLFLAFSFGPSASAIADDAVESCNQFEDRNRQIRGCTEYIRSGKALGPNLAVAYTNRGIAYASAGDYKRALADFNEAVRLAPDSPFPYYNRGNLYYDRQDYARALADYDAAIERGPELALAYYNRGLTHQKLGHREKSIEDYQKALSLDPGSQAAKERLHKLGIQ